MIVTANPAHCAKFTDALLPKIRHLLICEAGLWPGARILDPFAGTGKGVEYLATCGFDAVGIELEPEFIESPLVEVGNALRLRYGQVFDAIVTSPTYGNRMADKDMRESVAGTYAKSLGRLASADSSCHMQWGEAYKAFHYIAWREAKRVLVPGGYFLLNIKNHIRGGEEQLVSEWHLETLDLLGFSLCETVEVPTPGQRLGANSAARVDFEYLHLLQRGRDK